MLPLAGRRALRNAKASTKFPYATLTIPCSKKVPQRTKRDPQLAFGSYLGSYLATCSFVEFFAPALPLDRLAAPLFGSYPIFQPRCPFDVAMQQDDCI